MPFPDLPGRLSEVRERIDAAAARGGHGQAVRVVAVTKGHGPEAVAAAWHVGLEDIGENRVQEALQKMANATAQVRWHLIGHVQRNKIKWLQHFQLVHSLDSPRLADAMDAYGVSRAQPVNALVQVNVVGEETKGGYSPSEMEHEAQRLAGLRGVRVLGVMTMAPFDADERTLRTVFACARHVRTLLVSAGHQATELSMGMSNDFEVAVEEGATLVRLGTILFGARAA
jgi:pyridoxal phosphate enzyme (YggS family)